MSFSPKASIVLGIMVIGLAIASVASANHSWGGYHWARSSNPINLKLGDNVTPAWESYLAVASSDWNVSSVLETNVVPGITNPKNCRPVAGRIEVCNSKYGNNGWLGLASVWIDGEHITQATTQVNDSYFGRAPYNKPEWKAFVMCQEVGHAFGLDHQDEDFDNANLGTCMDYTSNPGTNQHPNQHDYDMLEAIYAHLDTPVVADQTVSGRRGASVAIDPNDPSSWGQSVKKSSDGKSSLYVKDLGNGKKILTHIIWAKQ